MFMPFSGRKGTKSIPSVYTKVIVTPIAQSKGFNATVSSSQVATAQLINFQDCLHEEGEGKCMHCERINHCSQVEKSS
jgi:hypothetical protein